MSGFNRVGRCDRGCGVEMDPILPPPENPDRWVRVPPVGWWVTSIPPLVSETAAALGLRCPRCGQTARIVLDSPASSASAA